MTDQFTPPQTPEELIATLLALMFADEANAKKISLYIDLQAAALSQAQAELAALRAGAPEVGALSMAVEVHSDEQPCADLITNWLRNEAYKQSSIGNYGASAWQRFAADYIDGLKARSEITAPQPPAQAVFRTEAVVKAEAWREMAGWFSTAESLEQKTGNQWSADLVAGRLRAEADRLDPKGGA